MGKPDQGSAAVEEARRGRRARPWGAVFGRAQARGGSASAARGGSRVRVARVRHHGGAGRAVAGSVFGRGPGGPEEPRDGGPGRRQSSTAGQDRRTIDGERAPVREGGPAGGRRPFGPAEVDAMSGAQSISTRRAYGVQRVCRVWHCARSSVYARRQTTTSPAPYRRRARSAPPRTPSSSATFAGCSKRRPFMAKGTGRPGRSSGSRGSAPRRSGYAG